MQEILESEWTLGAVKHREEERLKDERAARQTEPETIRAPYAPDLSGDNWIAEAFRRRQEEERQKAAGRQPASADRAEAGSREVPVDNWLIEGFKRHQEEERRQELAARSEETEPPAVDDDDSSVATEAPSQRALVVAEEIGLPAQRGPAELLACADDEVTSGSGGALVALGGETALAKRPRSAPRLIAAAGVVIVALLSLIGLKSALWRSGDAPRGFDQGAPGKPQPKASVARPPKAAPPIEKEKTDAGQNPSQSEPHGSAPAARPAANGEAPKGDSGARPGDAAPVKPGDASTSAARPGEASQNSTPTPAAPTPAPETKRAAPSPQQAEKPPQESATPPAPSEAKDAAPPAKPDKDSTAKPAPVGSENSHEGGGGAEQDQNASDQKRQAPSASDAKSKQQAKEKSGARHSQTKTDGLSSFLKRTANSVRRFFGRIGAPQ